MPDACHSGRDVVNVLYPDLDGTGTVRQQPFRLRIFFGDDDEGNAIDLHQEILFSIGAIICNNNKHLTGCAIRINKESVSCFTESDTP